MDILENRDEWEAEFRAGWLRHWQQTGEIDWKLYNRPKNNPLLATPGVDLSQSRLLFISTAGAYLRATQDPFDAPNPLGDYSIRVFPIDTPFEDLAYAHDHFDHTAVAADPQVLLPFQHLADMVDADSIGELAPLAISFMGYQPDLTRVVDELIPPILAVAKAQQVQAALLVPAWPLCSQSVGLVARALEMNGIATTLTSWNPGRLRPTMPPRATLTHLLRGATLGQPGDAAQQRRVLATTLSLLAHDAPQEPVRLDEE